MEIHRAQLYVTMGDNNETRERTTVAMALMDEIKTIKIDLLKMNSTGTGELAEIDEFFKRGRVAMGIEQVPKQRKSDNTVSTKQDTFKMASTSAKVDSSSHESYASLSYEEDDEYTVMHYGWGYKIDKLN